jgi:hypothetical protein
MGLNRHVLICIYMYIRCIPTHNRKKSLLNRLKSALYVKFGYQF